MPSLDAAREDLRVGDEHVVADELHRVAERLGQRLPAVPVAFGQAVLDRDDRILPDPVLVQRRPSRRRVRVLSLGLLELVILRRRRSRARSRRRRARGYTSVAGLVAGLHDRFEDDVDALRWFDERLGANPPSSPTPVECPFFFRMPRSVWKISAPQRTASANVAAPTGMTMNSWKSTLLSACAPPFRMFIIGTGSSVPPAAAVERREMLVERHAARPRRWRAPAPSRRRAARWRQAGPCSACRRARSWNVSIAR